MKKLLAYMGVNTAVLYTLIGRGWGLLSGIVTLLLVLRTLSPAEQGYYYTFASLMAMQVLFELGMSYVVMQFASHEMAHLTWTSGGRIEGDANAKSRLRSLLLLSLKWYGVIAALVIVVIMPLGWMFFSSNQTESTINWQFAWGWLVFASALNVIVMPLMSLLEGSGRVAEIARLRMFQNILGSLVAWAMLFGGAGLLAMPAMSTSYALTVLVWLWYWQRGFFKALLRSKVKAAEVDWKTEIWPFQWKIALSWLSGYFIFQLFTPVLFAYRGAIEAGQMGMSMSIANALMSIPMAWMSTAAPKFGTLVAKSDYDSLDRLFRSTLFQSLAVMVMLGAMLVAVNYYVHIENIQFAFRILDPLPFTLLILTTILNYVTYAESAYLRAHKVEPFLTISLISAVLIATLTYIMGKRYGAEGIMFGYLFVCASVGFGWGSLIFISKRREWKEVSKQEKFLKVAG